MEQGLSLLTCSTERPDFDIQPYQCNPNERDQQIYAVEWWWE